MEPLIDRVIKRDNVFFRHQKMEEEDLTNEEKTEIMKNLAENNPILFLTRYGRYMASDDCEIFDSHDDPTIVMLLKEIRGRKEITKAQKRNRRFLVLQKLLSGGEYFSDIKMREREPYLFDAMIGRFLSEKDQHSLRPTVTRENGESSWSGMIERFAESSEISERRNLQEMEWEQNVKFPKSSDHGHDHSSRFVAHVSNKMMENDFQPEEDDDEEEEDDEIEQLRLEMERLSKIEAEQYNELGEEETPEMLRSEFESFMQQKFLAGKDKLFFDYSKCDMIDEYDSSFIDPIKERDDEEKWFDEDD